MSSGRQVRRLDGRRAALLIGFALLALVLGVVLTRETSEPRGKRLHPGTAGRGAPAQPLDPEAHPAAELRVAPESSLSAITIRGRVLDDAFGVPIAARIEPGQGAAGLSDPQTGGFRLVDTEGTPGSLFVSSAGFESQHIELDESSSEEELEIRLRPSRSAAVLVQQTDGSSAAHVLVTWQAAGELREGQELNHWIQAGAQRSGEQVSSNTDLDGVSRMRIAVPAIAVVQDPRSTATRTVRVRPGEEVLVVLPDRPLLLKIVDADSLEPLAEQDLEAWWPRDPAALIESLRSDSEGLVALASTSFPVLLRVPGSSAWQHELVPLSPGVSRTGFGGDVQTLVRIDWTPGTEALTIGVRGSAGRVRLLDENSGEPVDAPVRVRARYRGCGEQSAPDLRCTSFSPRSAFQSADEIYLPRDGVVVLPFLLRDAEHLALGQGADSDLVVTAAGYRPLRIEPSTPSLPGDAGIPTYALQRADLRWLRVVHEGGAAFTRRVGIYSPAEDFFCYAESGRPDGLHGPFDWPGGDLLVSSGDGGDWSWSVSSARLAESAEVTLTVPRDTGSIVVQGIPDGCSEVMLVAKLGLGLAGEYYPTSATGDSCRFDDLPTGSYLVGPREWIRGAEMQSVTFEDPEGGGKPRRIRTRVKRGQVSRLEWVEGWAAGRTIEGRVQVLGSEVDPFLVPLYGVGGDPTERESGRLPRMILGRRSPRIPLDRHGRYEILPTDPLPKLIAICVADETSWGGVTGFHVLEVIAPGETVEIPTASVELHWKGEPAEGLVEVGYLVPVETLRHPLPTFHTDSHNRWATGAPLRLEGIPVHVRELFVAARPVAVRLREGETMRVDVDIQALPAPRDWSRSRY